jgi:hypothetical protein
MGNAHDITLAYAIIIIVVVSSAANAATVVCGDGLQSNETKVVMNKERRRRRRRHQGMGGFRIRLHWQKGYNWQNTSTEKYWCMECRGGSGSDDSSNNNTPGCISGTTIQINKCSSSSIHQKFIAIGMTIRPVSNPDLCFTITGYDGKDTPIN